MASIRHPQCGFCHRADCTAGSPPDYKKYIDPLLGVADFGIHYYDDGAADASVLSPMTKDNPYDSRVSLSSRWSGWASAVSRAH